MMRGETVRFCGDMNAHDAHSHDVGGVTFACSGIVYFPGAGPDDATEAPETDEITMTEEPIEDRIRRAYVNGFRDGIDRAARGSFDR